MEVGEVLKEIGLSDGETKVYLALLKLGPSPVSKVKEETGLHRTTIYDFLEKLLNKGLVNYNIKGHVKQYKATNPEKLLEVVKEKERYVKEALPELKKMAEFTKDEMIIETYKGVEGFKMILQGTIKEGKDFIGFGIDEAKFQKTFGHLVDQQFQNERAAGLKERMLTSEDTEFVYDYETVTYRFIPPEYFSPTPTMVYGDNVVIIIWEPLHVIRIKNAGLAEAYTRHFEMLWKMASTKPKGKVRRGRG
ncbi:hypothetical protein KY362_04800 [Candidatus Woesearchaeota archaeon]|nr:hypothetical protein [Candidatus Woesearchaeota archaeon]